MKKITIDASTLTPGRHIDGVARTTEGLVSQLDKMELPFEISLFTQRLRGERLEKYKFKKYHLSLPRWSFITNLTQKFPIIESICKSDLYHIPHNHAPYHSLEKCIVTIHDAMFLSHPEKHLGHEQMAKEMIHFAQKCKAIITCSEHSKKDISKHMNIDEKKIHVTYWGINHDLFKPIKEKSKVQIYLKEKFSLNNPFFLSNSCNVGRKNTPLLIDSYLKFLDLNPKNDLVLVWRNPPKEILEKINNHPKKTKIHILKDISDDDLVSLYQGTDATIIPTLYEGFGLPVLEAMACGSFVVTTSNSSIPEVGGNGVLYIEPTFDDIYKTLIQLEEDKINKVDFIKKALIQANKFTWENCANNTLEIYKKYVNEQ